MVRERKWCSLPPDFDNIILYISMLGTSDEHLSISQFMADSGLDGAVIVTTPQEISLQVCICGCVFVRVYIISYYVVPKNY